MPSGHKYTVEVTLASEAIFNSGEKERNLVHAKALADRYGLVYFHAKTFKGQLKRQAFWLLQQYRSFDERRAQQFLRSIIALFGINRDELNLFANGLGDNDQQSAGMMKLGHLQLDERIRQFFIQLQLLDRQERYTVISPHDLIEAQTCIRTSVQIEDDVVRDRMMTTYHTVKEGLTFYSEVVFEEDASAYIRDLERIVCSLRRIGAGIHRGRGRVVARLLSQDKKEGGADASVQSY